MSVEITPNDSWKFHAKHRLFRTTRYGLLPWLRLGIGLKIYGLENVPKNGGALIICNHVGWFDPILLLAASPRPIMWMAKAEIVGYPVLSWFARQAGAFPVNRGRPDLQAIRHAQKLLEHGRLVGMFPEGTRSKTGALKAPLSGASLLAVRGNAPVIPCALVGTDGLPLGSGRKPGASRKPSIQAVFGEPFMLLQKDDEGRKRSLEEMTDAMMIEIARLLPAAYRGVYADRVNETNAAISRADVVWTGEV